MKKLVVSLLVLALALAAGCASNPIEVPLRDLDGNLVRDGRNNPVVLKANLTDSAMYHYAQVQALAYRKPIAEFSFPNGGTMPKGAKLVVWGNNGQARIAQYKEPWVPVARAALNMTPLGLMAYTTWRIADTGARGSVYNIHDLDTRGSNLNVGGTQVGGASTSMASAEGATSTGGSASPDYEWSDSGSDTTSLGGIGY